jgi:predicted HNH restriction endonuclease
MFTGNYFQPHIHLDATVLMSREGEDWSERECLMAIWAYSAMDRNRNVGKADLYRDVSKIIGRSSKSVEYKVQNVSACDRRPRLEKPISEKPNYQRILRQLYDDFGHNPSALDEMHTMFAQLAEEGLFESIANDSRPSNVRFITEGGYVEKKGLSRKRSSSLRHEARKHYRSMYGVLKCAACDKSYDHLVEQGHIHGEIIQVHHLMPISELEVADASSLVDALKKVAPLCPTCHVLVHSHDPILTPEQLRSLLEGGGASNL